jgi:hypothetical protein
MHRRLGAFAALQIAVLARPAAAQVDSARAAEHFAEAAALCQREAGRLWGISLCGPMVFADAATGTIAVSRPAPDAPRPRALGYANTAVEWGGERWAAFVWPAIPQDSTVRARMLLHELFHRVQPELGLYVASSPGTNDHLDTRQGRYWMQLEWRALDRALETGGTERRGAVADALGFRHARRQLESDAAENERISEINEGLAQYTGTAAAASPDAATASAIEQLRSAPQRETFVRTFAYPSGAAYGLLLDAYAPEWRRRITAGDDLGALLAEAADVERSDDPDAAALRYGGADLLAAEVALEAERERRIAKLRARFVTGPVLVLPRGRGASFVTTGVTPIPGAGTVLPSYRVQGEWGEIEASHVLVSTDGNALAVPGPFTRDGTRLAGEGWTVVLADTWDLEPGPRPGDYRVVRSQNAAE